METLHIIILIFSLLGGNEAGYDCVERCHCLISKAMIVADCAHLNMKFIPQPTGSFQIQVLSLEDNLIENLSGDEFESFKHLRVLNLTGNSLKNVEGNALSKLSRLRKLDLSKNKLQAVTKTELSPLKYNLTWLSVAQNFLHDIPEGLSEFKNLKYLDISGNPFIKAIQTDYLPTTLLEINLGETGVSHLTKDAFERQQDLVKIHLDKMLSLEYVDLSGHPNLCIGHDTFHTAPNLTSLIMRNSGLTETPSLVNHEIVNEGPMIADASGDHGHGENLVWYNPKLELLDLSGNPELIILPTQMIFPPSLEHLKLRHANIPIIDQDFLEHATKVRTVDLSFSNILSLDNNTFMHLEELEEVVLSGNPLKEAPHFPPSIRKIRLSHTSIVNLTIALLGILNETAELDLSNNGIQEIEDGYFAKMTHLQRLNLSGNAISVIRKNMMRIASAERQSSLLSLDISTGVLQNVASGSFLSHSLLEDLHMDENVIKIIEDGTLEGLINLRRLFLQRNDITDISPGAFSKTPMLQIIHLEHNRLEVLLPGTLGELSNLRELHLQFNKLHTIHRSPLPSLVKVDISNNRLQYIPVIGGKNLTKCNASLNFASDLDEQYFQTLTNLAFLNLSYNEIRDMNNTRVFSRLTSLQVLDLEGNIITNFPSMKLPSLTELRIGKNKIHELKPLHGISLTKLRHIDISRTNLTAIEPKFFDDIPSLEEINLPECYLSCTCDLRAFVNWVKDHENITVGANSLRCYWPLDSLGNSAFQAIENLMCETPKPVSASTIYNEDALYIGVSLTALTVLILIIFLIRARYKPSTTEVGEYEMQSDGQRQPTTDGNSSSCCSSIQWIKCCFRSRASVYSRSRRRLFSDDDNVMSSSSTTDRSAPTAT